MGRTVLVTGAAGGIGAATARRLAAAGARLVLADLDGPRVEALAAELDQVAVHADVTREADVAAMVDEAYRRWGRLDVLFNNAGVIRVQPLLAVTPAEWELMADHPVAGERILLRIPDLKAIAPVVRHEHEHWDGSGYPDGLAGAQIPIGSRIILACDAFAARSVT